MFSVTRGMSYPKVLFVAHLNSLKDRQDKINLCDPFSKTCVNRLPVSINSFPLATLLQFLLYALAHLSLAQPQEQNKFEFVNFALNKYHSSL